MPREKIVIDTDGSIEALYSDDKQALGRVVDVTRASHVEWGTIDGLTGWYVQLSDDPRNGEHAGKVIARGVPTRQAALDLEVEYLNKHCLR